MVSDAFEIDRLANCCPRIGVPAADPTNQNSSTGYFRIFAQSTDAQALVAITSAIRDISLKHFSGRPAIFFDCLGCTWLTNTTGFHSSLDMRTAIPRPYLAYYPALLPQTDLQEEVGLVDAKGTTSFRTEPPTKFEPLAERESYDTKSPIPIEGPFRKIRLGDVALGRSGDKGGNLNFGLFVQTQDQWNWLRSYMTLSKVQELLADDWQPDYSIERVEFPGIFVVHFVVYGILGRGVSSSKRLDGFGKGFIDYFRDKVIEVPVSILS